MKLNEFMRQLLIGIGTNVGPAGWNSGVSSIWPEQNRLLTTGW